LALKSASGISLGSAAVTCANNPPGLFFSAYLLSLSMKPCLVPHWKRLDQRIASLLALLVQEHDELDKFLVVLEICIGEFGLGILLGFSILIDDLIHNVSSEGDVIRLALRASGIPFVCESERLWLFPTIFAGYFDEDDRDHGELGKVDQRVHTIDEFAVIVPNCVALNVRVQLPGTLLCGSVVA